MMNILEQFRSSESVEQDYDKLKNFHKRMKTMEYGFILNGKIVYGDYDKYSTIPIALIEKYNAGICWDFVNYQQNFFNKNNINSTAYFFIAMDNDDNSHITTHTFNIVSIGRDLYWFEAAFRKHSGIHKVNSYNDVVKILLEEYGDDFDKYIVSTYNTAGMDNNLTSEQFINKACNRVIKSGKCS